MVNSVFVANATEISEGSVLPSGKTVKADKNGLSPILLRNLAGTTVNKSFISGTLAETLEIFPGKSYLIAISERQPDEQYGRQFSFIKLQELSAVEIVQLQKELGAPVTIDVTETKTVKSTEDVPM